MQRKMTVELDIERVERLVQNLDPALAVGGFARLQGGSTEVYRIDLADPNHGPLVLKIYPDEPEWGPSKEALVAGWLEGLTPPVPRWLQVDNSRTLLPLRYALLTLLPVHSLRNWLTAPDIEQAYLQMGELLRRIHAMPIPAYGYIQGHGIDKPTSTNADYMIAAFDKVCISAFWRSWRRRRRLEATRQEIEQAAITARALSTITMMDRIAVLDRGHIVEEGRPEELAKQDGLFARLWKRQTGGFIPEDE